MALYRAVKKLFIAGVIRNAGDEFEYSGPPRPEGHMVLITKPSGPLAPAAPSTLRPRLAPAHPDLPVETPDKIKKNGDLSDPRDSNPQVNTRIIDDLLS